LPTSRQNPRRDADDPARLFVDSGVWLALPNARDQHHLDAVALIRAVGARKIPLVTTNLVLAEVHRFALFRHGPRVAATALARIESSPLLSIEHATKAHHRAARDWLQRLIDHRLSYTDAVSFAVMDASRRRAALGFDHDFVIAGFELWRP
jgi:predicted nucleic acid-binding protein